MPTTYGLKSTLSNVQPELEALVQRFNLRSQGGTASVELNQAGQERILGDLAISLPSGTNLGIIDFDMFVVQTGQFHVSRLTRAHFRGSSQTAQGTPAVVWENYTTTPSNKDWASISWTVANGVLTPKIVYGSNSIPAGTLEFMVVVTIKGHGSFLTAQQ